MCFPRFSRFCEFCIKGWRCSVTIVDSGYKQPWKNRELLALTCLEPSEDKVRFYIEYTALPVHCTLPYVYVRTKCQYTTACELRHDLQSLAPTRDQIICS